MITQTVAQSLLSSHASEGSACASPQMPVEQLMIELQPDFKVDTIACPEGRGKPVDEEKLRHAHRAHLMANLVQWIASETATLHQESSFRELARHEAEALAYWAKGAAWSHLSCYPEALNCYDKAAEIVTFQGQRLAQLDVEALVNALTGSDNYAVPQVLLRTNAHLAFRVANLIESFILQRGSAEPELKALSYWATEVGLQHFSPLGDSDLVGVQLALLELLRHGSPLERLASQEQQSDSPTHPPTHSLAHCLAKLAQTLLPHLADSETCPDNGRIKAFAEWAEKIAQQHLSHDEEPLESHQQSKIPNPKSKIQNPKLPPALIGVQAALAEVLRTLSEHHAAQALSTKLQPDPQATLRAGLSVDVIAYLKECVDSEKLRDAHLALRIANLAESLVPQIAEPEAEALAYWAKGSALLHLFRYREALACYQPAAAIFAAEEQLLALVGIQAPMVATLRNLGNPQGALALAKEARATCLALGKPARRSLGYLEMNVGVIYRQLGKPEAALAAYQRGRDIFVELGDDINVARLDINRAYLFNLTSRFIEAQKLLQSARQTLAQTGQHAQQVARVDSTLALLAHHCGRYQEALAHFEAARQGLAGMDTLIAAIDLRRSSLYSKLNLIEETINLARTAESIFTQNGMVEEQAQALYQLGVAYQLAGHLSLAESYLTKARQLFEELEASARVFELDYKLACLAHDRGQLDDARQVALKLSLEVPSETWPKLAAQARLLLAQCALGNDPARTYDYAQAALKLAESYLLRETAIAAYHLMGQSLERTLNPHAAWSHYQTAIQLVESLRVHLLVDELRIGFMDDKLPIYGDAVRLSQLQGSLAELLYTLNLAHTAPLLFNDFTPDSQLQNELITLREKWHWYQNKLEEVKSAGPEASEWRQKLNQLEGRLADLIHRSKVHHTTNIWSISASPEEPFGTPKLFEARAADRFLTSIQQSLGPKEALLHYYLVNETFQALLVTKETIHLLPNLIPTKLLKRILRGWRLLLNKTDLIRDSPETSLALAQRHMARLYQKLVAPLALMLEADTHLFVVMPPGWHELPLAAFFDGQRYLVERYQLTYLSAPEVLLNRAADEPLEVHSGNDLQALIIGHSDGGRLTGTIEAAQTVAQKLKTHWQTTLLVDEDATIDNVQAATRESHLIHLSTHAVYRQDNPLFSWARLAGHCLTVADLYQMKLPQNPLVVLAACETGRGKARGGGLLGMGRALLAAGASGVVVTLWRVEDQATAQLTVDFYQKLGSTRTRAAVALRQAQLKAIASHQHPFFWAGFIFIQA